MPADSDDHHGRLTVRPEDRAGGFSRAVGFHADGTTPLESRLSDMSQSRTARFRGRSPPDRDAEWEVSTVARRGTNHDGSAVCAVTGTTVALSDAHYLVTLRKPALGVLNDYDTTS